MTTNIVGSISQSQKTVAENIGGGGGGGGATAHAACPTAAMTARSPRVDYLRSTGHKWYLFRRLRRTGSNSER